MANTFTERIKLTLTGAKKATKDAKKFETGLKKIQNAAVMAGGSFFAAQGLIEGFKHIINLSMETEKVAQGFMNLGKEFDISRTQMNKLRGAVNGTMNDMELMTLANQSMALGVAQSTEEMSDLFDTAQRLGRALGVDTKSSVESLVTGMGRQSIQMLDNLGIIVKQEEAQERYALSIGKVSTSLTEQEKKLAFNAEAMRQARKAVEALGEENLSTADNIDAFGVRLERGFGVFGRRAVQAIDGISQALGNVSEGEMDIVEFQHALMDLGEIKSIGVMRNEVEGLVLTMNDAFSVGDMERWSKIFNETNDNAILGAKDRVGMLGSFIARQIDANELGENELTILTSYYNQLKEMESTELFRLEMMKQQEEVIDGINIGTRELTENLQKVDTALNIKEATPLLNGIKQGFNDIAVHSRKASDEVTKTGLAIGLAAKSSSEAVSQASSEFITAYIQQAIAIMVEKAFGEVGFFGGLAVAAGSAAVGQGLAKSITKIQAAEGFDGVVTEPTLILAGEAGPEYVDIEPTTNEGANRGGGTVIFQGNIMSDNFIEEEAIPKIKEALRRGADIGIG